jgi:Na+-driven multidrug efflux pump
MIGCTAVCLLLPKILIGIFSNNAEVVSYGVVYLRVFSIGFVMVGTIMVASAAFQGLGKTYPSLIGAVVDNALFAGLVFTLPVYFDWGIQSIWWIKMATAAVETAVVAIWLKHELAKIRLSFTIMDRPAQSQTA